MGYFPFLGPLCGVTITTDYAKGVLDLLYSLVGENKSTDSFQQISRSSGFLFGVLIVAHIYVSALKGLRASLLHKQHRSRGETVVD